MTDPRIEAVALALYSESVGEQITSWEDRDALGSFMRSVHRQYLRSASVALAAADAVDPLRAEHARLLAALGVVVPASVVRAVLRGTADPDDLPLRAPSREYDYDVETRP